MATKLLRAKVSHSANGERPTRKLDEEARLDDVCKYLLSVLQCHWTGSFALDTHTDALQTLLQCIHTLHPFLRIHEPPFLSLVFAQPPLATFMNAASHFRGNKSKMKPAEHLFHPYRPRSLPLDG